VTSQEAGRFSSQRLPGLVGIGNGLLRGRSDGVQIWAVIAWRRIQDRCRLDCRLDSGCACSSRTYLDMLPKLNDGRGVSSTGRMVWPCDAYVGRLSHDLELVHACAAHSTPRTNFGTVTSGDQLASRMLDSLSQHRPYGVRF